MINEAKGTARSICEIPVTLFHFWHDSRGIGHNAHGIEHLIAD
jgi:hypothetical protein